MFGISGIKPIVTAPMALWCLLLYLLIVVGNWRNNVTLLGNAKYNYRLKGGRTWWIFILFFLFVLTWWLDSDYFGYIKYAINGDVDFNYDSFNPLEYGHQFIASLVNGNWICFRVMVWGTSLVLYVLSAKRFGINIQHSLYILFVLYFNIFSYGRVTLAMALYFYGLSFLCKPIKSHLLLSWGIGICLILSCSLFHRSAVLMIITTPLLYMATTREKGKPTFYLICLILVFAIIYISVGKIYSITSLDDRTIDKLARYSDRTMGNATLLGIISNIISYTSYILPNLYLIYYLLKKGFSQLPIYMRRLLSLGLSLFCISIAFYFSGEAQFTLFYRTLFMTMIPISLVFAYMFSHNILSKKVLKLILFPAILRAIIMFLFVFYNLLNNGVLTFYEKI